MKNLFLISCLAVAACGSPPCLEPGEPARIEHITLPTDKDDLASMRVVLRDKSKRVCAVSKWIASELRPGDVIRGPLSRENDWRLQ